MDIIYHGILHRFLNGTIWWETNSNYKYLQVKIRITMKLGHTGTYHGNYTIRNSHLGNIRTYDGSRIWIWGAHSFSDKAIGHCTIVVLYFSNEFFYHFGGLGNPWKAGTNQGALALQKGCLRLQPLSRIAIHWCQRSRLQTKSWSEICRANAWNYTGWWLTYPSVKYSSNGGIIPNMEKWKMFHTTNQYMNLAFQPRIWQRGRPITRTAPWDQGSMLGMWVWVALCRPQNKWAL